MVYAGEHVTGGMGGNDLVDPVRFAARVAHLWDDVGVR